MKGTDKKNWTRAFANEKGRLFQGIQDIKGTSTCFFIHKNEVPQFSKVTYSRIVCYIRHQKTKTHRVRLTVGGNKISHEGKVSTPTSYLTIAKLHWNSVLSTPYGKFFIVDVKNFYQNDQMNKA